MKIRCFCGRFMLFIEHDPAVHGAGGQDKFECRKCHARAVIWHAHGLDDWPVGGLIWSPDGREEDLDWSDYLSEWRPKSMMKLETFLCRHCGRPVTPNEVIVHFRTHYSEPRPYVCIGPDYAFLVREHIADNGRITLEFADPQPPRSMLHKAAKEQDLEMPPGKYPLNHDLMKWILKNETVWEV